MERHQGSKDNITALNQTNNGDGTGAISYWPPGAHILMREVWEGRIWTAKPVIVVQDEPNLTVLFMPHGTCYKHPRMPDGGQVPHMLPDRWLLVDRVRNGDTLFLCPAGSSYMVMLFRVESQGQFAGWYINLQEPLRRICFGFDYLDQELDIVVSPDRTSWKWKDEDGFEALRSRGIISPEQALRIRAEGERVISQITIKDSLFNQGWHEWSPPETWTIPTLPSNWNVIEPTNCCSSRSGQLNEK